MKACPKLNNDLNFHKLIGFCAEKEKRKDQDVLKLSHVKNCRYLSSSIGRGG